MTNKPLEILLVEDNNNYSSVAKKVIESKGYKLDITTEFKEAENIINKRQYDFIFIDGFFPYSKEYKEKIEKQGIDSVKDSKEHKELKEYASRLYKTLGGALFPPSEYIECINGDGEIPFGLILAENLEQKGNKNYLIVSSANHHHNTYQMLNQYAKEKDLNVFIEDTSDDDAKAKPEYWEKVLNILKENEPVIEAKRRYEKYTGKNEI